MKSLLSGSAMLMIAGLSALGAAAEQPLPPTTASSLGNMFRDSATTPKFDSKFKHVRFMRGNTTLENFAQIEHLHDYSLDSLGNLRGRYYLLTAKTPWIGNYRGYFASGAVRWRGRRDADTGSYFGFALSRRIGPALTVDASYQYTSYFDDEGLSLYTLSLSARY